PSISATWRAHGRRCRSGTPTTTCAAPQRMAMRASAVNTAAVSPAATCPPPPLRPACAISATAPTPSASVDTPTSVVRSPQTTKRTPTKSTCASMADWRVRIGGLNGGPDGDADLDAHRRAVGRRDAQADARAVGDAGWHADADMLLEERVARSAAERARFGPRLAAAAAVRARDAHGQLERDDAAVDRFARRERELGADEVVGVRAEKRVAHAFDRRPDRRKIDRNFVREAVVHHHQMPVTIGVDPHLVKATNRMLASDGATKIMPESKECPLCGGAMQYRETTTPVQVPGNPNATARTTRE